MESNPTKFGKKGSCFRGIALCIAIAVVLSLISFLPWKLSTRGERVSPSTYRQIQFGMHFDKLQPLFNKKPGFYQRKTWRENSVKMGDWEGVYPGSCANYKRNGNVIFYRTIQEEPNPILEEYHGRFWHSERVAIEVVLDADGCVIGKRLGEIRGTLTIRLRHR